MIRNIFAAAFVAAPLFASPASADDYGKEDSCKYQGQVMAAVQAARLDRVPEAKVEETIRASNPEWPENFSNAIPQLTQHVYQMKRRDLKNIDLGEVFETQCVENWDQIQEMKKNLSGG
ncbi:hypothetical protein TM1040_2143 [Ruegeria sp. TM1040]|jgi:hypothetical protein|uniref:hypothetical protein n=1 Tax=Ruegeria sp. (strain TM1040) TaxID=292414 RepID=UPI0000462FB3|nr:hypothetical protein [Ruegeria sp. TM1040]ABF64875.1 hypothetical protein TM1040_2143 [Ruegeria sp. TM1040]